MWSWYWCLWMRQGGLVHPRPLQAGFPAHSSRLTIELWRLSQTNVKIHFHIWRTDTNCLISVSISMWNFSPFSFHFILTSLVLRKIFRAAIIGSKTVFSNFSAKQCLFSFLVKHRVFWTAYSNFKTIINQSCFIYLC